MAVWKFHPKVTAATFGGYLATVVIAEAARRGYPIAGEEGAALTGIMTVLSGIMWPDGNGSAPVDQPVPQAPQAPQAPPIAAPAAAPAPPAVPNPPPAGV